MEINKSVSTIIILIIALLVGFLFALPEYQQSQSLQQSVAQKQAEFNSQSVYYANVDSLIKNIENDKDALDKINSALPDSYSLAPLMYFFQKKGTESGLAVNSLAFLKISPQTSDNQIRNIVFTMSVSGTYQSLKNFLSALDTSARLFEVNSISFNDSLAPGQNKNQFTNPKRIYDFNLEVQTNTY